MLKRRWLPYTKICHAAWNSSRALYDHEPLDFTSLRLPVYIITGVLLAVCNIMAQSALVFTLPHLKLMIIAEMPAGRHALCSRG